MNAAVGRLCGGPGVRGTHGGPARSLCRSGPVGSPDLWLCRPFRGAEAGSAPHLRQTASTLPSEMRMRTPSKRVSSKKASSSLKPSDISWSMRMATASPSGSESV